MDNKQQTVGQALKEIQKMRFQIDLVDKLGGRESFFGMKEIFEIILKEEHDKLPEEEKTGMYRFKGMRQYGNIITINCAQNAVRRCVNELKFTKQEFEELLRWYEGRSIDCVTLYYVIKLTLKDLNIY